MSEYNNCKVWDIYSLFIREDDDTLVVLKSDHDKAISDLSWEHDGVQKEYARQLIEKDAEIEKWKREYKSYAEMATKGIWVSYEEFDKLMKYKK